MENLKTKHFDVDSMLAVSGDFSKYQFILLVLFSIINSLSAYHYFGQTFISVIPDYVCSDKAEDVISVKECSIELRNGTEIPCKHWEYNNSYGFVSIVEEVSLNKYFTN